MPGLFGLTPEEIMIQQRSATDQRAQAYGQASPIQRINEGYYRAGAGLADAGAGLFGLKNPQVEQARQLQALTSNGDLSADGLIMMAKKLNDAGFTDKALLLVQKAKEMKLQEAKEEKEQALTKKYSSSGVSESDIEEFNEWQTRRPQEGASPQEIAAWWRSAPRAILQKAANNIASKDIAIPKDVYGEAKGREKGKLDARIEAGIPLVKQGTSGTSKSNAAQAEKTTAQNEYFRERANDVISSIADIYGTNVQDLPETLVKENKKGIKRLDKAAGNIDEMIPTWALPFAQDRANIIKHLERLDELSQKFGLLDLRKAGVAPGSITEKEWKKFARDLGNIDRGLGPEALHKQLIDIYGKAQKIASLMQNPENNEATSNEVNVQTREDLDAAVELGSFSREEANRILRDPQFGKTVPVRDVAPVKKDKPSKRWNQKLQRWEVNNG